MDDMVWVVVFIGSGGNFCVGVDLVVVVEDGEWCNCLEVEGDGLMGLSCM